MSDLTLVLQTILRSKEPLTAEQVSRRSKVKHPKCGVYLSRLVFWGRIARVGSVKQDRGRPRALYGTRNNEPIN
jgi:predicted transcriptional regulator